MAKKKKLGNVGEEKRVGKVSMYEEKGTVDISFTGVTKESSSSGKGGQ